MNVRNSILKGATAAARFHNELQSEDQIKRNFGSVDVFSSVGKANAVLIFRPLHGLLGACLPGPTTGVIISTQRPLAIQRFTAAHELGHVVMDHQDASLDSHSILNKTECLPEDMEIQANSFAAAFLTPKWLIAIHGRKQGWNWEDLKDPLIVYQLSLRLGASYQATCIALKTHNWIDPVLFEALWKVPRKGIKEKLLHGYRPNHWRRNVWRLSEKDEGTVVQGEPEDLFFFCLNEKSGSGYLWDINDLKNKGFLIVNDVRGTYPDSVGVDAQRQIITESELPAKGEVLLAQRRLWNRLALPVEQLHLTYDLLGKEEGLPRFTRQQLTAA